MSGRTFYARKVRRGNERFGWKAQEATLEDFVLTACAVELGLHVPQRAQSGLPEKPDYRAPGLDLVEEECDALVAYVAGLPRPVDRGALDPALEKVVAGGKRHFAAAGCAACHVPRLGEVDGIYSDLLLHDMGPGLGDQGNYGAFAPDVTEDEELDGPVPELDQFSAGFPGVSAGVVEPRDESKLVGATRQEWRTPPLWGLRDSAPYLHDGRAATVEQAIALHGGEAARSARRYFELEPEARLAVRTFLDSLAAPE